MAKTMSPFVRTITELAEKEGDFISDETLKEMEEMIRFDEIQKIEPPSKPLESKPHGRFLGLVGNDEPSNEHFGMDITPEQAETIKKVCEAVKVMAEGGKFVCKTLGPLLGPIGTVAGVVVTLIDFMQPKEEDPVIKELGELKTQLTALSEKVDAQFTDLKSFIVEKDFASRYSTTMSKLFMYMIDTMTERTKKSVDLFEEVYMKDKPQELVYEMLAKLENEMTNPLKWAMKGDNLQSKATFEKWKGILESVLTEALFLETYAAGLLPSIGQHGLNKILEKLTRFVELEKQWNEYYLNTEDFWPAGVKKLVNEIHENKGLHNHQDMVNALWEGIKTIHTNFQFLAAVFEERHIYGYYKHYEDQAIVSVRDGYVIMVYRSVKNPPRTKEWLQSYAKDHLMDQEIEDRLQFNKWSLVRSHFNQENMDDVGKATGTFFFAVVQYTENIATKHFFQGECDGPGFMSYRGRITAHYFLGNDRFPLFVVLGA